MAYVYSSPWQDAANFGGAIGDRLTAALIDLPLRRQQAQAQALGVAAGLRQNQISNQQGQQRLNIEQQNANSMSGFREAEVKNQETRIGDAVKFNEDKLKQQKLQQTSRDIEGRQKMGLEGQKQAEVHRHNLVLEQAKAAHDNIKTQAIQDKSPHPEFGGMTLGQMIQLHGDPVKWDTVNPQIQKNFENYLNDQISKSNPQVNIGGALGQPRQPGLNQPGGLQIKNVKMGGQPVSGFPYDEQNSNSPSQTIKPQFDTSDAAARMPGGIKLGQQSQQPIDLSSAITKPQIPFTESFGKQQFDSEMAKLTPAQRQVGIETFREELAKTAGIQPKEIGGSVFYHSPGNVLKGILDKDPHADFNIDKKTAAIIYYKALQAAKAASTKGEIPPKQGKQQPLPLGASIGPANPDRIE